MISKTWTIEQLQSLHLSLVGAYRGSVPKPCHWYGLHNQVCVLWLLEHGSLEIRSGSSKKDILPGTWVFQMPGLHLDQVFSPDARLISIRFRLRWPSARSLFRSKTYKTMEEGHYPLLKEAALQYLACMPQHGNHQEWRNSILEPDDAWLLSAAQANFLRHWYRCAHDIGFQPQGEEVEDKRVAFALQLLEERLHLRDVPYTELNQHLSLSKVQMDRLFNQHLGHSPKREHDLIRLLHAQQQLQNPHLSIKQIAAELGFKDASQFAKWFRRLDGRNPRVARRDGLALV